MHVINWDISYQDAVVETDLPVYSLTWSMSDENQEYLFQKVTIVTVLSFYILSLICLVCSNR